MREWLMRLFDWLRRDRLERDLIDELRFHRQQLELDAPAHGATDGEALRTARRLLGDTSRVTEAARARWSLPPVEQHLQDVRYAARGLRRSPAFTVTAVLTVALGVGANVAMFGVVDRLMFRPYPYLEEPGTVHRIYLRTADRGVETIHAGGFSYARFLDLARFTTSFTQHAAFAHPTLAIGAGSAAREQRVAAVSGTFWDFFDARPALGRFFSSEHDATPRGAEVAVLGHAYWQSEFGSRDVIGERLRIGHFEATVIGVAPEGFTGVFDYEPPAVYVPITLYAGSNPALHDRTTYYTRYDWGWTSIMVRRRRGVTIAQASADATAAYRRSWTAASALDDSLAPLEAARPTAIVSAMKPGAGPDPGLEARTALWLSGVAAIVLIIACANVTNLSLARKLRQHGKQRCAWRSAFRVPA